MSLSGASKPGMSSSSADKPVDVDEAMAERHCVVAFYNITWDRWRFKTPYKHEQTLAADIQTTLGDCNADVLLLSECDEIPCTLR